HEALLHQRREALARHVLDVAFAPIERGDDRRDDVDEEHAAARLGEGGGQRQADVAGPDDRNVVRHGGQAQPLTSAAMRSDAWPSPYSGGASGGKRACASASASPSGSAGSTRVFAPAYTVSTHSVFARSVTHGMRSQYASFCRPPESVTTRADSAASASSSR